MKSTLQMNLSIVFLIVLISLSSGKSFAQADLTLTINELLTWQPNAGNQNNICNTPVSQRVRTSNFQISSGLDTNARILYCPDGMNNFGPYIDSANSFNLFNFSHWQYIDILCWFGGSAGEPILIPSKAWVDAAHRNGVKVIGTVFMAPAAFGGSQSQVQTFLQQDSAGNFIATQKLIEIANYFNFDGWILNFETSVNSATGNLAASFVANLDSIYSGEVIWYDAMLVNGSISYQNRLNANNAYFFQHSTGLFTNYNWSSAATVNSSATYATGLGLDPFNVYTGADMWPGRPAQTAFTDYTWIDNIITGGIAKTSIAMFAMNFTFNYGPFSNFNNDSTDYKTFYSTERKIFSGVDEDPFVTDATWKGLVHYIPVRTNITSFPFETDFNTGHGLKYFSEGTVFSPYSWHNMSHQSALPSWTFNKSNVEIDYDFENAYTGGSSLSVHANSGGTINIPLFSTNLNSGYGIIGSELAIKTYSAAFIDSVGLEFIRSGGLPSLNAIFHPSLNGNWENLVSNVAGLSNTDTIIAINFIVYSSDTFTINIGSISIDSNYISTTFSNSQFQNSNFRIFCDTSEGSVKAINESDSDGLLNVFDLNGRLEISKRINKYSEQRFTLQHNGVYLYEFSSQQKIRKGKLFVY